MARRAVNAVAAGASSDDLVEFISEFYDDPLGFVIAAYPWGEADTPLHDEAGPDEWQVQFLTDLGEAVRGRAQTPELGAILMAVASGHGVGKAQPKSLLIDTPDGPRRWGDLRAGDFVFGLDGRPTRIVATHEQGERPVFRVRFDDKTETVTCGEHLWRVRGRNSRRSGTQDWETISTAEIVMRGVTRKNGAASARQWQLPCHGAVQYPWRWVPMEPYALGVWLGDGSRNTAQFTLADPEVREAIIANGGSVLAERPTGGAASVMSIERGRWILEKLGVVSCHAHEKFVPTVYKHNVGEVRAAVLRGLLDTDGCVTPTGAVVFTSASDQLARDVAWLARSLGGKAVQHAPTPTSYKRQDGVTVAGRPAHSVTLTMPDGFRCFEITRKQDRVRHETQKRYLHRWIDAVESAGTEECMCITVEAADSLYLTNDFIPTHNSALICWVIQWFMSTRDDPAIVVTANTANQLMTKTWRELSKWHRLLLNADWFQWTATKFYLKERPDTWAANAIPWSKERSEAFAGTHAKHVLMLFDEASAIDDTIYETAEGALTTAGAIWLAFGNPTKNSGRFRECWRRFRHRWDTRQVDARRAKKANQGQLKAWIDDYGEDSDFARVRVRGEFPRAASSQLISGDLVEQAQREMSRRFGDRLVKALAHGPGCFATERLDENPIAPRILSVDVARFGGDQSVIGMRQGRTFVVLAKYRELEGTQLAYRVAEYIIAEQPDATFVDGVGYGASCLDTLRDLGYDIEDVNGGVRANEDRKFFNRRAEMWWLMREWLKNGGAIPAEDKELADDLTTPEYGYSDRGERVQLETKEDMRARGMPSPDTADCLAMTFYMPVAPKGTRRNIAEKLAQFASGRSMYGSDGDGATSWMSG